MKYFVVSDLHSCLTPLLKALHSAGYDKNNTDHTLIIAGDLFDRGTETLQLYDWLMSIPKDSLRLIRGNHEDLFVELLRKKRPTSVDFHNGTIHTICQITNAYPELLSPDSDYWLSQAYDMSMAGMSAEQIQAFQDKQMDSYWKKVAASAKGSEIGRFILEKGNWVNFVETRSYIIVHGFIPIKLNKKASGFTYSYFRNWRTKATNRQWENARWSNFMFAYELIDNGLFDEEYKEGKKLICGHTPARYFREHYFGADDPLTDHISNTTVETSKLIALDARTVVTGQVNVFSFEE